LAQVLIPLDKFTDFLTCDECSKTGKLGKLTLQRPF
jgi:hypothetical protein